MGKDLCELISVCFMHYPDFNPDGLTYETVTKTATERLKQERSSIPNCNFEISIFIYLSVIL